MLLNNINWHSESSITDEQHKNYCMKVRNTPNAVITAIEIHIIQCTLYTTTTLRWLWSTVTKFSALAELATGPMEWRWVGGTVTRSRNAMFCHKSHTDSTKRTILCAVSLWLDCACSMKIICKCLPWLVQDVKLNNYCSTT